MSGNQLNGGSDSVSSDSVSSDSGGRDSRDDLQLSPVLLPVTWLMTLQVWWSYFWRTTLYVVLAGGFFGFLIGLVYGMLGNPMPDPMVFNVVGTLLSVPISLLVLKDMLEKKFRRFSIALVARQD